MFSSVAVTLLFCKVNQVIAHMKSFQPKKDYREAVRKVEAEIFDKYPATLIGNQATSLIYIVFFSTLNFHMLIMFL